MSRALSPLLSAVVLLASVPGSRAADEDPKAIVAKAIKAHGGEDDLAKYKAAQATNKGKITLPGVGEVEFTQNLSYMLPDKIKDVMELSVGGQKINVVTVANGDKISIEVNGKAIEVPDQAKEALKDARHMMKVARLVPLVREKGYELSLIGEVKVEDKPAIGVRVSAKDQKDINLFFDKETGLLAKLEHRTADPTGGNEVTEERIILEYQKNKDGIPMPKKVVVRHDGKTFIEAEVIEATLLEKLDDSEFTK
ncbi:MAG TPA: hypothetical protein VKE74_32120 [Gemmataceae bacterium]|nr:hypothetical protein [Gemmataceae bacterium]